MRMMSVLSAGLVAASLLGGGVAIGQQTAPDLCRAHERAKTHAPKKIEGKVVKVDPAAGTLTIEETNGKTREFRASAETLKTMKAGDQIEANLRSTC